jgi:hypothetical protein
MAVLSFPTVCKVSSRYSAVDVSKIRYTVHKYYVWFLMYNDAALTKLLRIAAGPGLLST